MIPYVWYLTIKFDDSDGFNSITSPETLVLSCLITISVGTFPSTEVNKVSVGPVKGVPTDNDSNAAPAFPAAARFRSGGLARGCFLGGRNHVSRQYQVPPSRGRRR